MSADVGERDRVADDGVGNTAVNRSFTFGVRGRTARLRHQLQGLAVFGVGLALSTGALAGVHAARTACRAARSKSRRLCSRISPPPFFASCSSGRGSSAGRQSHSHPALPHTTVQGVLMTTTAPATNTAPTSATVPGAERPGDIRPGDVGPGRMKRLVRGRPTDPAWVRPSLFALLIGTAFLYIWGLGASGWANSFYSAAVQAGSTELEGVLLRLLRLRELHHGRQATGVAVGDGAVRAHVRGERVEHSGAAGA